MKKAIWFRSEGWWLEQVMDKVLGSAASETSSKSKPPLPWINRHAMHTLAPLTNIKTKAYSVGDVQLTGIVRPPLPCFCGELSPKNDKTAGN